MSLPSVGDLFTFPLRSGRYGVAQVLHVDDLALHDIYHVAVHDAVVDGEDGGYDSFGEPLPRVHDVEAALASRPLIHHVGLTIEALDASDAEIIATRDVDDDAMAGYRAWLDRRYQDAVRRGMLRVRGPEVTDAEENLDYDEELEAEDGDEVVEDGDEAAERTEEGRDNETPEESAAGAAEEVPDATGLAEDDERPDYEVVDDDVEGAAPAAPRKSVLSFGVTDLPLGTALMQFVEALSEEPYREAPLASHLRELVSGGDAELIAELVQRFSEGDYGAGQELLDHGRPAVEALAHLLDSTVEPELADDILQILGSSGEMAAYEHIATFFETRSGTPEDPLYRPAVRGYCYAVMLTEADPEPLRQRLGLLESIEDRDLAEDVATARQSSAKWR